MWSSGLLSMKVKRIKTQASQPLSPSYLIVHKSTKNVAWFKYTVLCNKIIQKYPEFSNLNGLIIAELTFLLKLHWTAHESCNVPNTEVPSQTFDWQQRQPIIFFSFNSQPMRLRRRRSQFLLHWYCCIDGTNSFFCGVGRREVSLIIPQIWQRTDVEVKA